MVRAHAAAHECCQVRTLVGFTCTGKFKRRNLGALADLIVGNAGRDDAENEDAAKYFPYRSSMYITDVLQELGTEYQRADQLATRRRCSAASSTR